MGSERTPDLDLPALRAVIAKALSEYDEAVEDFWHSGGDRDPAVAKAKADGCRIALVRHIATLASACERLAEENERLRGEVARLRKAQPQPAPSKNYTLLGGTITPAPAGKGGQP